MSTPSNYNPFNLTKAFEEAQKIEHQNTQFKSVVGISVSEVLEFYCATGDFPQYEHIRAIATHGVQAVLNVISDHKLR